MNLPLKIRIGDEITIRDEEVSDKDYVGYFDEATATIVLPKDATEAQRVQILIHELMHVSTTSLKQAGIIKRAPDHEYIHNCSTQLMVMLALCGVLKDVSKEDVESYLPED